MEGGEWYVQGWGKEDVVKADESVSGDEVRLV